MSDAPAPSSTLATGPAEHAQRGPGVTPPAAMARAARGLTAAMLGLMALGLVAVTAASVLDGAREGRPTAVLEGHLLRLGLALCAFLVGQRVAPRQLCALATPLWLLAVALLIVTLFAGISTQGAQRWIDLGPISFQPSELARLSVVLVIGAWAARSAERMAEFRVGVAVPFVLAGIPGLLTFLEPDFGSSLYMVFLGVVVMWVGGARTLHLMGCSAAGLAAASIYGWERFAHVSRRISGFWDPQPGSQVHQGLTAMGAGHAGGRGLGEGLAGQGYVPEAESDFVLAVLGEELGLAGSLGLLLLYAVFLWHGLRLLLGLRTRFGMVVGAGLLFQVLIQALLNVFVVTGMAPAKGLPLPFLSAGGTSLLVLAGSTGLLLGLARRPEEDPWDEARWAQASMGQTDDPLATLETGGAS